MKRIKYYYNTKTLRYERLVTPFRVQLLRFLGFIFLSFLVAGGILFLVLRFMPSPRLKLTQMQLAELRTNYKSLAAQTVELQDEMALLEARDHQVYRSIFQADPLPDTGQVKMNIKEMEMEKIAQMDNEELSAAIAQTLDRLQQRVEAQFASYDEIALLIKDQSKKLASIPAIQPVSNQDLNRIASGFGLRIDPIYGTPKLHKGLDFSAPSGTPIYATGAGRVVEARYEPGGYGKHVIINNGYGYETLYGHMSKIKVSTGERVKRGEVIGLVGSTGKSTGPHCHYEVHVNGRAVDPVYFFYNDLTPEQFDRILKIASTGSAKSLD